MKFQSAFILFCSIVFINAIEISKDEDAPKKPDPSKDGDAPKKPDPSKKPDAPKKQDPSKDEDASKKPDPGVRRCAAHDECKAGWRCIGVKVGKCK